MICNNCGFMYDRRTVGFKAVCESCGEYLHSCYNCELYDQSADRCRSLTTEAVSYRTNNNYCEEFVPNNSTQLEKESRGKRTSGDFDSLFD